MSQEDFEYEAGNLKEYTEELCKMLRLSSTPTALKFYKKKADMLAVPKVRLPKEEEVLTACQMLAQATRLNFTVGFSNEHMPTIQCSGVCGFIPKEDYVNSGHLAGAWYATAQDSIKHQQSMFCLNERFEAIVATPMVSGRVGEPDVCLVYGTPQQTMFMCCALQYDNYEMIEATFCGETSCTDSWVRAYVTQKPCFTIPCFGERRFGGVLENEMLMAFPPRYIAKILSGLKKLSKNGMRYPVSFYGIQNDVRAGMGVSYDLDSLKK